jgi:hypothetical protein
MYSFCYIHLNIHRVYIHNRIYVSRKAKTIYNLEQREHYTYLHANVYCHKRAWRKYRVAFGMRKLKPHEHHIISQQICAYRVIKVIFACSAYVYNSVIHGIFV